MYIDFIVIEFYMNKGKRDHFFVSRYRDHVQLIVPTHLFRKPGNIIDDNNRSIGLNFWRLDMVLLAVDV